MMTEVPAVRTAWASDMILGEGTLYCARENALYWVDIKRPAIHRLDLENANVVSIPMPD
jgi:xylono-1,5-lactonase